MVPSPVGEGCRLSLWVFFLKLPRTSFWDSRLSILGRAWALNFSGVRFGYLCSFHLGGCQSFSFLGLVGSCGFGAGKVPQKAAWVLPHFLPEEGLEEKLRQKNLHPSSNTDCLLWLWEWGQQR